MESNVSNGPKKIGKKVFLVKKNGEYSNRLNENFFRNHKISGSEILQSSDTQYNEEDIYGEIDKNEACHYIKANYNNRVPINGTEYNFQTNNSADNITPGKEVFDSENATISQPLARYKLKNKKHRHVYHDIKLPHEKGKLKEGNSPPKPPMLPFKPHHMRGGFNIDLPPPLPPKIPNRAALIQRKQLTEEYFENIRRCISDETNIATSSGDISPDQASTSAVSVQVPGTESNPYWTIKQRIKQSSIKNNSEAKISSETPLAVPKPQTSGSHFQLIQSLKCLKRCGWYWGNMKWEEAELMLQQLPGQEGLFLVRDSQDPLHILTLTVRSPENTIHHIRIEHTDGKFQLYEANGGISRGAADCVRSPDIVSFINLAMKHSRSGTFTYFVKTRAMGEPPVQIRLLSPISRFACVKSLKYYCRFSIREAYPLEYISRLPIPAELKTYASKPHYFDSSEDLKCALAS